jgi:hypothetical protein
MGTRSTTKIYYETTWEDKTSKDFLLGFYSQYDGYVSGVGNFLKEFIKEGKFVNGYSSEDKGRIFNGVGCCVLQMISYLKESVGGYYAIPESESNEQYNYTITFKEKTKDGKTTIWVVFECLEDEEYYEEMKVFEGGR